MSKGRARNPNIFLSSDGSSIVGQNGTPISGVASYTWAQFIVNSSDPTVGIDPTVLCNYMISDRSIYPGGGAPIFSVDPLGAGNKRFLQSPHMYVPLFSNRPAASDFPGMTIMIGDYGNCLAVSDGTDWVAKGSQTVYEEQNGTLTTPTKSTTALSTSHTFTTGIPDIPANLIVPGKTIMRCYYTIQRHGAAGTNDFAIRLGTVGNSSDPIVTFHSGIVATDLRQVRSTPRLTFPTASFFVSSRAQPDVANGTSILYEGATLQWDITAPLKTSVSVPTKNATDTIDLIDLRWVWER